MANQRIGDIAFDASEANVSRNDEVVIRRNNVNYRARVNGKLFLPAATSADAGKRPMVSSTGDYVLEDPPSAAGTADLLATSGNNPTLPFTMPAGTTTGYRMFHLSLDLWDSGTNSTETHGMWVMPISTPTYSNDGSWRVWFPNANSVNLTPPPDNTVRVLRLYGVK